MTSCRKPRLIINWLICVCFFLIFLFILYGVKTNFTSFLILKFDKVVRLTGREFHKYLTFTCPFCSFHCRCMKNLTNSPSSNRSVTIISAFFDVGLITKDGEDEVRDSSKYMKWAEAYKYMKNPMVIFTDKEYVKEKLLQIRKHSLRSTLVIVIPKHWLWSFRLTPWIEKIISNPDYPKYYPNTVNPEYASAMFAKTELVAYVAKRNFFQTKFHCWVDIGYFRYILVDDWTKHFWLEVPDTFDRTKIAMTGVFDVDLLLYQTTWHLSPEVELVGGRVSTFRLWCSGEV